MNWTIAIVAGVVFVACSVLKRLSFVTAEVARKHLAQGVLVMDVRSPEEFRGSHIPNAVNIPLDELHESLPGRVRDTPQILLLHCLSGTRSGIAKRRLKGMGYANVFNLGSLGRAWQIVSGSRRK
ncbi:MAG: rhodanese-like domain-containing protein [Chloroflexi bacterium]|nr:rhodanese-like domain-containing protein [Chloroflexota bacterium]